VDSKSLQWEVADSLTPFAEHGVSYVTASGQWNEGLIRSIFFPVDAEVF
jgi:hypothetical protein